jgi:hypothetical protein
MRHTIFVICIILSVCGCIFGQSVLTKTGTTVANYLNIDVGSRAVAMGGSFVAVANDVTAMYWNPSGIARIEQNSALFSHTKWIADIDLNFVGLVIPISTVGSLGVSAKFLTMEQMERTTIESPDGNGELFDAGSYVIGISYGRNLTEQFSIGASFKYIQESIYHSTASAIAFDIGTLFTTGFNNLQIGMVISNYGTKMRMDGKDLLVQIRTDDRFSGTSENTNAVLKTDEFELPLMFRLGISMDILQDDDSNNLLVSVDALHPNNSSESLNLGIEYVYNNLLALRAGYNSLFNQEINTGLTFGAGLYYSIAGTGLSFEYAYQEFNELLQAQMFTVGIEF